MVKPQIGKGGLKCSNVLEQQVQTISQCKDDIIQHNLILVHAAHNIHHDVAFGFIEHNPVVVEDDVCCLFRGFLKEAFLEGFLRFHVCVWLRRGLCVFCELERLACLSMIAMRGILLNRRVGERSILCDRYLESWEEDVDILGPLEWWGAL